MNSAGFQPQFSPILIAVMAALLAFGILYNAVITWAERKRMLEGYTAYAVALGVLVTLAGVAVVDWRAAVLSLAAFTASGLPMLAGSTWRYIDARHKEREYERQAARMAKQRPDGER